jgi:uncharacterized protein YecA (UPF0149 family)
MTIALKADTSSLTEGIEKANDAIRKMVPRNRRPSGAPFVKPLSRAKRNGLCPCGSGRKFKRCHGGPKQ